MEKLVVEGQRKHIIPSAVAHDEVPVFHEVFAQNVFGNFASNTTVHVGLCVGEDK